MKIFVWILLFLSILVSGNIGQAMKNKRHSLVSEKTDVKPYYEDETLYQQIQSLRGTLPRDWQQNQNKIEKKKRTRNIHSKKKKEEYPKKAILNQSIQTLNEKKEQSHVSSTILKNHEDQTKKQETLFTTANIDFNEKNYLETLHEQLKNTKQTIEEEKKALQKNNKTITVVPKTETKALDELKKRINALPKRPQIEKILKKKIRAAKKEGFLRGLPLGFIGGVCATLLAALLKGFLKAPGTIPATISPEETNGPTDSEPETSEAENSGTDGPNFSTLLAKELIEQLANLKLPQKEKKKEPVSPKLSQESKKANDKTAPKKIQKNDSVKNSLAQTLKLKLQGKKDSPLQKNKPPLKNAKKIYLKEKENKKEVIISGGRNDLLGIFVGTIVVLGAIFLKLSSKIPFIGNTSPADGTASNKPLDELGILRNNSIKLAGNLFAKKLIERIATILLDNRPIT